MKFFDGKKPFAFKRPPNVVFMILAIIAATIMWMSVNKWNKMEAQIEVGLDYTGVPANLMVVEGLENKLMVRLRGPERLLRSMPKETLRTTISLKDIKVGENTIPLGHDVLDPLYRAFEVIDIQPPRIQLKADRVIERSVSVQYKVESPLEKDNALTVEKITVNPSTVVVRGPEAKVNQIPYLDVTIRPNPQIVNKAQDETLTLDTPNFVTAMPPAVRVQFQITSGRAVIDVTCPIKVAGDVADMYEVQPSVLNLKAEVPEALQKDAAYLKQLAGTVAPPALKPGESRRMKPRIAWPEGMKSLSEIPDVVVTRKDEVEEPREESQKSI